MRIIKKKSNYFLYVIFIAFFALVARLYYLQIIKGSFYLRRSESNFIQDRALKHSRGKISDANGKTLVDNRLSYDIYVTFALLPDSLKNLSKLLAPLSITRNYLSDIDRELLGRAANNIDENLLIAENIDKKTYTKIKEIVRINMISGVILSKDSQDKGSLWVNTIRFPSHTQAKNKLASIVGSSSDIDSMWSKARGKSRGLGRFSPTILLSDIGFDSYTKIENAISMGWLSGISVISSKRRRYLNGHSASHVIGFVNQVSIDDLKNNKGLYRGGDYIGRNGIEATQEDLLRGEDGVEKVVVDAKGRRFDSLWEDSLLGSDRYKEPISGSNMKLSIDLELQKAAEELFTSSSGSVVVVDVNTGFVLALASFPSFDPNNIVKGDAKYFSQLINNKMRPLRNKAVQDHYSPGSIFKPITAIAGLSNHIITPSYRHFCTGRYSIARTTWRCFRRWGHKEIDLKRAIAVSCDSYFYELGHKLGLELLSSAARNLGFGAKTDISLIGESEGILPTKDYYSKRFGYVAPGFAVNMAIGQGDLSVTPLQMAMAYSAIANGGAILKPQLIREITGADGKLIKRFTPKVKFKLKESEATLSEILLGMSSVASPYGSASIVMRNKEFVDIKQWINEEGITIVGKTGTAQVVKLSKSVLHVDVEDVPYHLRDHAWFVGLYPNKKPQIAIVVMTEHGGYGGATSAPTAIRLMKKWHEIKSKKLIAEQGSKQDV